MTEPFMPFQCVRYVGADMREEKLFFGDRGTIVEIHDGTYAELETCYTDGATKFLGAVLLSELEPLKDTRDA